MVGFKQCTCLCDPRLSGRRARCVAHWLEQGSVLLLAPPGGGKGEQCARLARSIGGSTINAGELLRQQKAGAMLDPTAVANMDGGGLVPTNFFLDVLKPALEKPEYANEPLILDGVGRKVGEEKIVPGLLSQSGHPLRAVIVIEVSVGEATMRLTHRSPSGALVKRAERADDSPESLPTRFDAFRDETGPVIEHYEHLGLVARVNGSRPIYLVEELIIEALHGVAFPKKRR